MGNQLPRSFKSQVVGVRLYLPGDEASVEVDLRAAVHTTLASKGFMWTVTADRRPVEIYGVIPTDETHANVWSHGEDWHRASLAYLRLSREVMQRLSETYGTLYNVIESPTEWVRKWLKFLKCDIQPGPSKDSLYFEYNNNKTKDHV